MSGKSRTARSEEPAIVPSTYFSNGGGSPENCAAINSFSSYPQRRSVTVFSIQTLFRPAITCSEMYLVYQGWSFI